MNIKRKKRNIKPVSTELMDGQKNGLKESLAYIAKQFFSSEKIKDWADILIFYASLTVEIVNIICEIIIWKVSNKKRGKKKGRQIYIQYKEPTTNIYSIFPPYWKTITSQNTSIMETNQQNHYQLQIPN